MSSIDSRIVTMKFDNTAFAKGVASTMDSLSKLKSSLDFSSSTSAATKGLSGISGVLSKFGITNPFAKTTQGAADLTTATTNTSKGLGVVSSVLGKFGLSNPFSKTTQGAADLNTATSSTSKGLGVISSVLGKFGLSNPFSKTTQGASDLNTASGNVSKGLGGISSVLGKFTTINPFSKSTAGIGELQSSTRGFSLSPITDGISGVSAGFVAMSTIAITALSNITNKAVDAGLQLANSFTIAPIKSGLEEYETNLNSIQTILANTGLEGEKGLNTVTDALDQLNEYSDKTIYNFSEMARNIGTFTAAGVDLDTSVGAIKGIANLAAISGSNSQQASTAMYQLSQALASGKVSLMDWNSVVNAGMGGEVFQNALLDTARVHGVAADKMVKDAGSFRSSLEKGWLTDDILTDTLAKFTGDLTAAQLKNQGYNAKQIKDIIKMGNTATDAATKVKTMSALINTLQETATSGWAKSFELILGDFGEAKELFTAANDVLGGMLGASADARNKVLRDWNKLGGRDVAIKAISNAFQALMNILTPIKQAFRDIFPATTGKGLFELTKMIRDFTEGLIASKGTMDNIRSIFRALFAVIGVGVDIVQGLIQYFVIDFLQLLSGGTGGLLDFSGSIADVITSIALWLREGNKIGKFFDFLSASRAAVLGPIIEIFSKLLSIFAGFVTTGAQAVIEALVASFKVLQPTLELVGDALKTAGDAIQNSLIAAFKALQPILANVGEGFKIAADVVLGSLINALKALPPILEAVGNGLKIASDLVRGTFIAGFKALQPVLDVVKSSFSAAFEALPGILANVKAAIADAFGSLSGVGGAIGGAVGGLAGIFNIGGATEGAKKGINEVQQALSFMAPAASAAKNEISGFAGFLQSLVVFLAKVGGGIGVLLGKIVEGNVALLKQMFEDFASAWPALSEFFGELKDRIIGYFSDLGFNEGLALVNTGFFIALYAMFARFMGSFGSLVKAFTGTMKSVGGVLDQVSSNLKTMQTDVKANIILKIAIALGILAVSLYILSKIDAKALGIALGALSVLLLELVGALALLEKTASMGGALKLSALSVALVGLGIGLLAMSVALAILGRMKTGELVKGLISVAAILGVVIGAAAILSKTGGAVQILIASAAIGVLAVSLTAFAGALKLYASMDTSNMAEGALKVALALVALGLAMRAFPPSMLLTAAGLFIVAEALIVLAGALKLMGLMSGGETFQAILTLGIVLPLLAAAMIAMTGTLAGAASLLVVSAALIVLGTALAFIGNIGKGEIAIALITIAVALGILAVAGGLLTPVAPVLLAVAYAVGLLGLAALAAGAGLLLFSTGLAALAVTGAAGFAVLVTGIESILMLIPLLAQQFGLGLVALASVIAAAGPPMVEAMTAVIISLLQSIINVLPKVGETLRVLIAEMLKTLRSAVPDMITTGFLILNAFLGGLLRNIGQITVTAAKIITTFLQNLANNMGRIVTAGVNLLVNFLRGVGQNMDRIIAAGVTLVGQFIVGIARAIGKLVAAAGPMIGKFLQGIAQNIGKLIPAAGNMIGKFLQGIASNIGKLPGAAGTMIAKFLSGIASNIGKLIPAAGNMIGKFLSGIASNIGKLIPAAGNMIGKFLSGIASNIGKLGPAAGEMIGKFLSGIASNIGKLGPAAGEMIGKFLQGIASNMVKLVNAGGEMIGKLMSGITSGIRDIVGNLLSAGWEIAKNMITGITDGIGALGSAIKSKLISIASDAWEGIKGFFGVSSPSKLMTWLGKQVNEGFGIGLEKYSDIGANEAQNMATGVMNTIRDTMSGISDLVASDIDMNPVIAPVLDLTKIQQDASKIGGMLSAKQLRAEISYNRAASISADRQAAQDAVSETASEASSASVTFEQNNYSPRALSAVEIYRQTRNQLSLAKEELKV